MIQEKSKKLRDDLETYKKEDAEEFVSQVQNHGTDSNVYDIKMDGIHSVLQIGIPNFVLDFFGKTTYMV